MAPTKPPTPILDFLQTNKRERQAIGDFLSWLENQDIHLEDHRSTEQLIADFYDIDRNAMEDEKLALLEYVRECQEATQ